MPTVHASTVLPVLSLTLPTNGQTLSGIVMLQALADGGGVSDLQFRVNGSPVGAPITSGACSAEWNTAANGDGPYTVTAVWHDEGGATHTSNAANVTVVNAAPPIFSVTATGITDTSATINWLTGQTASSQVEYGLTTSYGNLSPFDATLVSNHVQTLTGLAPGTTYNYRVRSISWQGTLSISNNFMFGTGNNGAPGSPPSPPGGCVGPDPFGGGGTCWNGGWLPPGMVPPGGNPAPPAPPAPPATPPPAPPPGNCLTPNPFAAMGGGTCWDGGWLPPGMVPPNWNPAPPPSPGPPAAPPSVPVVPGGGGCTTPNPFAGMGGGICWNGGWLPPGMVPPNWSPAPPPPAPPSGNPAIPPTVFVPIPPPSGGGGCAGSDPFASMGGGSCWNGGWLPPGVVPPGGGGNVAAPPPAPPTAPGTCIGPDPFATNPTIRGVCINGGWVPVPRVETTRAGARQ